MLREVIVNIGLEKIDTQKEVTIEALLDNSIIVLVMSLEFARKQRFKLKKIEELIYVRNLNRTFNKKRPIENTVEVNIFYKEYKKKMEIDIIGRQKWNVILGILWLTCHNLENRKSKDNKVSRKNEQ